MILSGEEIIKRQGYDIKIEPFNISQVNPNSYNLKLYNELYVYTDTVLDMKKPNTVEKITIPESGYTLTPNKLYLGRTVEHTYTDKCVPMLEGRSSVGRLGICIHVTAGFGDVGFNGYWTLELFCIHPVIIYPHIEICQIYYHEILGDYHLYQNGKYNNNNGIQPSLMYKDFLNQ
jgi:dCTP deaminase